MTNTNTTNKTELMCAMGILIGYAECILWLRENGSKLETEALAEIARKKASTISQFAESGDIMATIFEHIRKQSAAY